jgi:hypothetical protein
MGSKSQPQTTNTTQTTQIPAWLQADTQGLLSNIDGTQPLAPYTGQGVAPLTPNQIQALTLASGNAGTAQNVLSPAIGGATNAMNFAAPKVNSGTLNGDITGLLSPYTATAVDGVNKQLNQQRQLQGNQIDANAAMDHAFGSDRNAVAHALNDQSVDQTIASTDANMLNSQFNNAANTALSAQQGNQNAAITSAGLNLSGSTALGSLAQTLQGLNLNDVNGLLATGGTQQQTQQAGDTFNYSQYLLPYQQLMQKYGLEASAISGAPHDTTTNGTQTSQVYSNPLAGVLGLGLGLASLGTGGGATLGGAAIKGLFG